jgi:hypothetical protein
MAKNDLQWSIGAEWSAFKKGVENAKKFGIASLKSISSGAQNTVAAFTKIGAVATAMAATVSAALTVILVHMANVGKELDDVSRESGVAADEILRTQFMLQRMGASAGDASGLLAEMRQNLTEASTGMGDAARWLALMGINVAQLRALRPSEQLEAIVGALRNLGDPTQRMAAANAILGSMGVKAMALAVSGRQVDSIYGPYIKKLAQARIEMAALWMTIQRIKSVGDIFMGAMASKIVPIIRPMLDQLQSLLPKMESAGEKFGQYIAVGIKVVAEAFKEGKLMTLVSDGMKLAFADGVAVLMSGVTVVLQLFQETLAGVAGNFGKAIGFGLLSAVEQFAANLMIVVQAAAAALSAALLKVAHPRTPYKDLFNQEAESFGHEGFDWAIKQFQGAADDFGKQSKEALGQVDVKGFLQRLKDAAIEGFHGNDDERKRVQKEASDLVAALLNAYKPANGSELEKQIKGGGKPLSFTGFTNVFDELRKIGGGLGNSALSVQDRQLEYTKQVAVNTRIIATHITNFGHITGQGHITPGFDVAGSGAWQ